MKPNIEPFESNEDIFVRQEFEVLCPYSSGANIFNKDKFDVEIFHDGNKKVVILRRKENI